MYERGLTTSNSLDEAWETTKKSMAINPNLRICDLRIEELKEIFDIANKKKLYGDAVEIIPLRDVLATGDPRDTYLVKFWCSNILDMQKYRFSTKYKLSSDKCPRCDLSGTQSHYINDCVLFNQERKSLINAFLSEGVEVSRSDLYNFINRIKIREPNKISKKKLITIIDYINDYIFALHRGFKS